MVSTVPLPRWRDLCRPPAADPCRPWRRPGQRAWLLSRSAFSLLAVARHLAATLGRPPRLALPAYICNQSLDPLRRGGCLPLFYDVDRDLKPLAETLPDADAALLVHYFGCPADGAALAAATRARGMLLIEDAAHCLRPEPGIGEWGDAVLYSPHKLLALPDGAVLATRDGLDLAGAIAGLGPASPSSRSWLIKRAVQSTPAGALLRRLRPGGQGDFLTDPEPHELPHTPQASPVARRLLAAPDLDRVAARRRANARALSAALLPLGGWQMALPDGDWTPYRLVLRCDTTERAAERYDRLRRAGLPVESWPDLPPEAGDHAAALDLRRRLLLLPVHQDLHPGSLADAYGSALA